MKESGSEGTKGREELHIGLTPKVVRSVMRALLRCQGESRSQESGARSETKPIAKAINHEGHEGWQIWKAKLRAQAQGLEANQPRKKVLFLFPGALRVL